MPDQLSAPPPRHWHVGVDFDADNCKRVWMQTPDNVEGYYLTADTACKLAANLLFFAEHVRSSR